jgi:hypothetical protein
VCDEISVCNRGGHVGRMIFAANTTSLEWYRRCVRTGTAFLLGVLALGPARHADAANLRVLDSAGLVRAVKVVRAEARIVITLVVPGEYPGRVTEKGECLAVHVDGLATERRVALNAAHECVFEKVTEGTWQVSVPGKAEWRVRVYE